MNDERDSDGEGTGDHSETGAGFLGLAPGTRVEFQRAANGTVVLTRADEKRPARCFGTLRGHAGKGLSTDAIMALTRGDE